MKRADLIKKLEDGGFVFERHGGSHDIYVRNGVRETIPRHREVNERLAKVILKRNGL
jgi:mRNA interferase HicA